ncbi:MAG: DUF362 domain-containing protein [Candidatus Margulisiibacteriota bacterium]
MPHSKVAIVKCPSYDQNEVEAAIHQGLELLGGLGSFVKADQKVLLKINALMDLPPEAATTTHPSIVAALAKEIKKINAQAFVGDSPGNASANIEKTMDKIGVLGIGAELVNFNIAKIIDVPSPSQNKIIPQLKLSQTAFNHDAIINLPKLKTHNWTLFTGAIKNLFGFVPGFYKTRYHASAPQPYPFAECLVDILEIVKPTLHIMDGIIGMEGPGPSGGKPRKMGALFFSTDPVALDAVCSVAIGYKPFDIDTTKIADERKLGTGELGKIEIVGTPLEKIAKPDWKHSASTYSLTRIIPSWMNWIFKPIREQVKITPEINPALCRKCLICVNNCPAKTIALENGKVKINLDHCIMCYCCHELCPYTAIRLKGSWLIRLMGINVPSNQ